MTERVFLHLYRDPGTKSIEAITFPDDERDWCPDRSGNYRVHSSKVYEVIDHGGDDIEMVVLDERTTDWEAIADELACLLKAAMHQAGWENQISDEFQPPALKMYEEAVRASNA